MTHGISAVARTAIAAILCMAFSGAFVYGQPLQWKEASVSAMDLSAGGNVLTVMRFDSGAVLERVVVRAQDTAWSYSASITVMSSETVLASVASLALGVHNQTDVMHALTATEYITVSALLPTGTILGRIRIIIFYRSY